jgi:CHAT domain-containing protein/Tfp pilus assembly protein PilF
MRKSILIAVLAILISGLAQTTQWAAQQADGAGLEQEARKLNNESLKLQRAGKYDEALPLAERALVIREKTLGPQHPDVADSLNNLARLYFDRGDYSKAEALFQRALIIREKALGLEHPDAADSLNNLARLYFDRGDYSKAEALFRRALIIREKALGLEHPDAADSLNNLANLYRRKGEYEKAEPLLNRALIIRAKTLGPEHPDVADSLNNLARLYLDRGDYAKAEPLLNRALAIREKALGPQHTDIADSLNNLARLYLNRGDYAKAEPLLNRALAIREKALGPQHPDVADSLNNLAHLYLALNDYAKAEPLLNRALVIREKALGPEHQDVAASLNNLASVYRNRGEYAKAEPLFRRALTVGEKALGPEHFFVAYSISNLARLYLNRGEYAKAEPLFQRALTIGEKALGSEHPHVAGSLNDLATCYAAKGDIDHAITFLSRANAVAERNLALTLTIGSERQKLAYLAGFSKQADFTLSLQSQTVPNDPHALDLAFTTLLRRKARGLDAMTDTIATLRRHASPQDQTLFDKLTQARSQLAMLALREPNPADPGAYRRQIRQLEEEVDNLEMKLSSRSAELRAQTKPITLAAMQAALPAGSVLIEFAFHTPREPQTEKSNPPRYLAYLLASQGEPKWVDLGEAALIDRAVDAWRKALRNPNRMDIKKLARAVDERVMRPVRSLLGAMPGDTRHLLIAPDGSLNLIPFAALVDEQNQYLIERYSVSYLTSGRDLLRLQTPEPSKEAPLIVANPDFSRVETVARPGGQPPRKPQAGDQSRTRIDPRQVFFPPLPGAEEEALAIKALLPQASVLQREEATETTLKQTRRPRILHIATHGFFINAQETTPARTRGSRRNDPLRIPDLRLHKWAEHIKNPLLRSGLALAGANHGKSGDDDGILTALEAAYLDLSGTKLVVLSAGDTGVGEVKNGEGVQGLRRAFVLAGSESQVMSLWPVSDEATRDLMIPYYKALQEGEGRGEGLRQAQLRMLRSKDRQHPFYWAAFIQSGEWANLDGRR